MNKFLIILLAVSIFSLSACVSVKQGKENLAVKLEMAKDPLLTIEAFIDVYGVRYNDDIYLYNDMPCRRNYNYDEKIYKSYINPNVPDFELITIKQLSKEDVIIECFVGYERWEVWSGRIWWNDIRLDDKSDACIDHMRKSKSEICHFDYKRFLPKNNKIKTENDFLDLATRYKKSLIKCDSTREERTSAEKEQCKEKARKDVVKKVNQ